MYNLPIAGSTRSADRKRPHSPQKPVAFPAAVFPRAIRRWHGGCVALRMQRKERASEDPRDQSLSSESAAGAGPFRLKARSCDAALPRSADLERQRIPGQVWHRPRRRACGGATASGSPLPRVFRPSCRDVVPARDRASSVKSRTGKTGVVLLCRRRDSSTYFSALF